MQALFADRGSDFSLDEIREIIIGAGLAITVAVLGVLGCTGALAAIDNWDKVKRWFSRW